MTLLATVYAGGSSQQAPQSATPQSATPQGTPPRTASPFQRPEPLDYANREGWTRIFDGQSLTGWSGNPQVWTVEDGAITASSTAEHRVGSTHIIWTGGEPADFELKLEMKLDGDIHSGIAYRSAADPGRAQAPRPGASAGASTPPPRAMPALAVPVDPKWTLYGPGLDYDADRNMAGNVEDRGTPRREVAWRGGIVLSEPGQRPRLIGSIGDGDAMMALLKPDAWNQIHIIARGHQLTHIINGQLMTVLIDEDPQYFRAKGQIGLQIEQYGAGRVHFREIWLKEFTP
jgi:hypothetical protein